MAFIIRGARRHRQGRESAIGYYEDAYDFGALARELLEPLGPAGNRRYRTSVIDLGTDTATAEPGVVHPRTRFSSWTGRSCSARRSAISGMSAFGSTRR